MIGECTQIVSASCSLGWSYQIETPVKWTHSDVEPESSPEVSVQAKRPVIDNMEETREAINSIKAKIK